MKLPLVNFMLASDAGFASDAFERAGNREPCDGGADGWDTNTECAADQR